MDNRVENLISAISRLREYSHTREDVIAVRTALNRLYNPDAKCVNFVYTNNIDKVPFGCIVFPVLENSAMVNNFLITGEDVRITEYEVELDSKMFDYGLTDEEIVAVILFNVYHLVCNFAPCRCVREAIDDYFVKSATNLIIHDLVQYQAILKLGCVDALCQVSSCLYLPNDVLNDSYLESIGLYCFKEALDKLHKQIPGCDNEATRMPKLSMLEWCLRLYCDVEKQRLPALDLLKDAKSLTGSILYINKINAAINALNRIDTDAVVTETVNTMFMEAKLVGGLLASLKYTGLRSIENDLYEFQIRAKNAETEQDVMYALKQINARLAILDDYIRQYKDTDSDIDRWIGVKMEYMEIRDILAKKKLHKRSYGIFVDYDALDKLDDEE